MLTAWETYYGLKTHPFSLTPDLRFAYHSRSHSRALAQVTEALDRREGLIVITGEIGSGKTMLCRTLLSTFEPRTFVSVVSDPRVTADELLQQMLHDYGMARKPGFATPAGAGPNRHQLVSALQQFLASLIPLQAHAVVMIDEAQHLQPTVLEEIRLLSNFETDEAKLLQIVLVGQLNLDDVLRRADMKQLNSRVSRRIELQPLSVAEVHDYVRHRLAVAADPDAAGGSERRADHHGVQFTAAAIELVAELSRGTPRVINTLCDRALEAGFARRTHVIDETVVRAAGDALKIAAWRKGTESAARADAEASRGEANEAPAPIEPVPAAPLPPDRSRRNALALAAALVVVATVGAVRWLPSRFGSGPPLPPASTQAAAAATPPAPVPPPSSQAAGSVGAPGGAGNADARPGDGRSEPAVNAGAAAAAAEGAAESGGSPRYQVQVVAFRTPQRAQQAMTELRAAGHRVEMRSDPARGWYQIAAEPLPTMEAASALQESLEREGYRQTYVVLVR